MTRARTLADMISDGVIGTTELADDVITPVKLDETGSYQVAGLTVSTNLLGPVAIESSHNGAYIKFRDSTSSPSTQYAWMGVAGNEIRLFVNDTEYPVAFNSGGALFNPQGGDNDFRVLSDTTNYALFVDGGANSGYGRVKISSSTLSTNTSTLGGDADTYINGLTIENNEASYTNGGLSLVNKYDWGYGSSIEWRNIYDTNGGTLGQTNRITSQWVSANNYKTDFYEMNNGSMVKSLTLNAGSVVVNEDGRNADFRIEANYNSNLFVCEGSGTGLVHIGKATGGFANSGCSFYPQGEINLTTNDNRVPLYLNRQHSDGSIIAFYRTSTTFVGSVSVTSSGTTYNTTSDRRLKTDIQPITNGTEKLMAMNPVTHTWINDPSADAVHGFIAQEMQEIVPEAVSGDPDSQDMMSMDYGRITPVLVAALQDAVKEITALKERVAELEAK